MTNKVKRKIHNKRELIAFASPDFVETHIPNTELSDLYKNSLQKTNLETRILTSVSPSKLIYGYFKRQGIPNTVQEGIELIYKERSPENLRIFITQTDVNHQASLPQDHKNLIVIEVGDNYHEWRDASNPRITSHILIPMDKLLHLVHDLLYDISIANADPFIEPLIKYIKAHSLHDVYRRKAAFAAQYFSDEKQDSIFPAPSADSKYASFSTLSRKNLSYYEKDFICNTVETWLDFAKQELADYFPTIDENIAYFLSYPQIGKQLSPNRLSQELSKINNNDLENPLNLLVFPAKKPSTDKQKKSLYSILDAPWTKGHFHILPNQSSFPDKQLQNAVREGYFQVIPFFQKS